MCCKGSTKAGETDRINKLVREAAAVRSKPGQPGDDTKGRTKTIIKLNYIEENAFHFLDGEVIQLWSPFSHHQKPLTGLL